LARGAVAALAFSSGVAVLSSAATVSAGTPAGAVNTEASAQAAWDIPGEWVVDFEDDTAESDIQGFFTSLSVSYRESDLEDDTRIEIATIPTATATTVLDALRADPRIERLEPHAKVKAMWVPNDPLYGEQWHMDRVGAATAWTYGTGRGVTVAVIDTGIACKSFEGFQKATDLAQTNCVAGYNLVADNAHAVDDHGHGTHVAGTIAQSTHNGIGGAGLAFNASLMPVKVLSADGWGTTSDVADGIRWAADHGAHVINLSLGGPRNSTILQSAVDYARRRGAVVVAAAGNTGGPVSYPGGSPNVIGVSATDARDELARFSARGAGVDIAAPGVDVLQQTVCEGGLNGCEVFPRYSGTSMAAPHVAAAAALLVSQGVSRPSAIEEALLANARPVPAGPDGADKLGAGVLDAGAATRTIFAEQLVVRLAALLLLTLGAVRWARRKSKGKLGLRSVRYWLAALATGVGIAFFLPLFMSRHSLWATMLSRPIVEWDLLVGASIHKFLPLAHIGTPLVLTAVLLRVRGTAPALAGFCVGTGSYLLSVALLGQLATPFGAAMTAAWCALNALACTYLGVLLLRRSADPA